MLLELLNRNTNRLNTHNRRLEALEAVTPLGVKRYKALLSQTGTDAPVATVLENTLEGTLTWARTSDGLYTLTSTNPSEFPEAKTWSILSTGQTAADGNMFYIAQTSETVMTVTTYEFTPSGPTFDVEDELLDNTPIMIEVYP